MPAALVSLFAEIAKLLTAITFARILRLLVALKLNVPPMYVIAAIKENSAVARANTIIMPVTHKLVTEACSAPVEKESTLPKMN